nr:YtfJ family protein [Photobacterium sp. OFAV2-7]
MTSGLASAASFSAGDALPVTAIDAGGIAVIKGDDVEFKAWSTSDIMPGVVFAQAARPEANELISPEFKAKIEGMKNIKVYSIVNADDAPFGAGMFIEGAIKEGKLAKPVVEAIIDEDGEIFENWELEESSLAVIVMGADGKVAYVSEGKVGSSEEAKILEAISAL